MRIDVLASQTHWIEHSAPVWHGLDPSERGTFYVAQVGSRLLGETLERAHELDIDAEPLPHRPKLTEWVIVCSDGDRSRAQDRKVILFQHGIGFSFHGKPAHSGTILQPSPGPWGGNSSYPGGRSQDNVWLFVNPNRFADAMWRATYPATPSVIVGMPKMDAWHRMPRKRKAKVPTVALTWHWNAQGVAPEARWAFPHYGRGMAEFVESMQGDVKLIAHSHPRAVQQLEPFFTRLGVEWVSKLDDVYRRAHVLVNDSSSVAYEFASLDRPVVILNAPWFRRTVHHGLRFWEHADVGVNVNRIQDLREGILEALKDEPKQRALRRAANDAALPFRGNATERAIRAIREVVGDYSVRLTG